MRGVNKAIILGTLGADPEIRHTPDGSAVANLRLATNESWKDKQTGEIQERTEWHRVVFFGRVAEVCAEYLKKGSTIYVEGQIQTRKWQDQDGNDRYSTEIKGRDMTMVGGNGRQAAGEAAGGARGSRPAPAQGQQPQARPQAAQAQPDGWDDSIPF